jgi:murein L,D-transpeptidase YafK
MPFAVLRRVLAITSLIVLAGCSASPRQSAYSNARAATPIPATTLAAMDQIGSNRDAPILIRAYKKESEIEIWKWTTSGRYALLKTYPVCRWSGKLGPKTREGDRQVPEGFYTVTPAQMNPNSSQWLAFNVGYPNAMERSLGRDGGDIMVHGTCSSRGCYAMTNEQIEEIYAVMREAFQGGQKSIQFQSYPFHMTAENLVKFRNDENFEFWKNLKEGSDRFEVTKKEPAVGYCGARYTFGATDAPGCGATAANDPDTAAVNAKIAADNAKMASLIASGATTLRISYSDGDQNPFFRTPEKRKLLEKWAAVGELSRPDALGAVEETELDHQGRPVQHQPSPSVSAYAPETSTVAAPVNGTGDDGFFTKWFGASSTVTPADPSSEPVLSGLPVNVPLPPRRG